VGAWLSQAALRADMKVKLRIAFRQEGQFWNAYVAIGDTMKGAFLIGSIGFGAVARNPEIKEAFMDLMKKTFEIAFKETTGGKPDYWTTRDAPENERGGSA
jgi:hypothetical protein